MGVRVTAFGKNCFTSLLLLLILLLISSFLNKKAGLRLRARLRLRRKNYRRFKCGSPAMGVHGP
jgi:hypothetical protein